MKICRNIDIPFTPIPSFDQVANDPQLLSCEMIVKVEQLISGKLKVAGTVFKMSKTPGEPILRAHFLGEHNREVYSGCWATARKHLFSYRTRA